MRLPKRTDVRLLRIAAVFLAAFLLSALPHTSTLLAEDGAADFQDRIDIANGLYSREMYSMALREYDDLAADYPEDEAIPLTRYRAAECLFFLEKYDEAAARYRSFLEKNSKSAQAGSARYRIGQALYQAGRSEEAFSQFKKLYKDADPAVQRTARYFSGKICFEKRSFAAAKIHLKHVTAPEAGGEYHPFANYYLGEIALSEEAYDAAAGYFRTAIESKDSNVLMSSRFGLGKAQFMAGDLGAAQSTFLGIFREEKDSKLRLDAFLSYLNALYAAGNDELLLKEYASRREVFFTTGGESNAGRLLAASSFSRMGNHESALGIYDGILSQEGVSPADRATALLRKARALTDMADYPGALGVLDLFPPEPAELQAEALYLKSRVLNHLHRYPLALEALRLFLENYKSSEFLGEAMLSEGYTYLRMQKTAEAQASLDRFMERFSGHPRLERTLADVILLDIKLEENEKAIKDSKRFLELFPKSPLAQRIHERLGLLYTETGDYPSAVVTYEEHLKNYPVDEEEEHRIFFLMGHNAQLAEFFSEAIGYYKKVRKGMAAEDVYASTLKNRAYCYVRQGDYDSAAEDYKMTIESFPENDLSYEVLFWLANHYREKEEPGRVRWLIKYVESKPDASEHLHEVEYFAGESYRLDRNFEEAIRRYNNSIEKKGPFLADAFYGKALCLWGQENSEEARRMFQEALKQTGDNHRLAIRVRNSEAEMYGQSENFAEAAKGYLAVAILYEDPDTVPEALLKAGEFFGKAGDTGQAVKVYAELAERYPGDDRAGVAAERLKELEP